MDAITEGEGKAGTAHRLWALAIGWMVKPFTELGDEVEKQVQRMWGRCSINLAGALNLLLLLWITFSGLVKDLATPGTRSPQGRSGEHLCIEGTVLLVQAH